MNCKYGKLFKKLSTNTIACFEYDMKTNYYAFIQEMHKSGFTQCIVTSDIMIKIMQKFILEGNTEIISIEFMVDDEELKDDINVILNLMKKNAGYWSILKQKLEFLSQDDCIEIKKVSFKNNSETGTLFSVQVNGILFVSEKEFDNISNEILTIVGGCIK